MRRILSFGTGRDGLPFGQTIRQERGVTGLETAIILIAFVVVASVFAFTVLSTGIFSSERGKETVFAGLEEAQGTLEPKGRITANGLTKKTLSLGDAVWTASSASTTVTLDTTDKKVGTGSADLLVLASMTTGLSAYENLAIPTDLTSLTQLSFWAKSSTTTTAGQVEVVFDETAGCGSPTAHVDVPALVADTWQLVTAAITQSDGSSAVTNANKDAVRCVGVEVETDLSSSAANVTLNFDRIQAVGLVSSIEITNMRSRNFDVHLLPAVGEFDLFDFDKLDTLVERGREAAQDRLAEIRDLLETLKD